MNRRVLAAALVVSLAACAQLKDRLLWSKGHASLVEGLRQYEEGVHLAAAKSLQSALEQGLTPAEQGSAHKHLAFISCASGRAGACREEFRQALAVDPKLELTAAESGHPVWGPVFRSLKAESSTPAAALSAGLKLYEEGNYEASANILQTAIERGLPPRELADARKHLAFIHCASGRTGPCRDEFRLALGADPALELGPAEAGHPAWGPVFRSVKSEMRTEGSTLAAGLKLYEEGNYEASAKSLQAAIDRGLPDKQRADAHKHLAFIHCAAGRKSACRDEFRKALAADPSLELAPAESGHPVWGPIFRSLKGQKR